MTTKYVNTNLTQLACVFFRFLGGIFDQTFAYFVEGCRGRDRMFV